MRRHAFLDPAHQRRHLHLFFASIDVLFQLFFSFHVPGTGDLEAFDIVFLPAAGFGLLLGQQGLPVGDRNLVIIGMNVGKCQKALAVAAIFDKGGLQRRLNPSLFGKIDIPFEGPLGRGFEI